MWKPQDFIQTLAVEKIWYGLQRDPALVAAFQADARGTKLEALKAAAASFARSENGYIGKTADETLEIFISKNVGGAADWLANHNAEIELIKEFGATAEGENSSV